MTMLHNGPLPYWYHRITSGWGPRDIEPSPHNGIDFNWMEGYNDIVACHYGMIRVAEYQETGFGWVVVVANHELETTYAHMQSEPLVKVGDFVDAGDTLGIVGDSGHSYGKHLHFGLRIVPWAYSDDWQNGYSDPTYALMSVYYRDTER